MREGGIYFLAHTEGCQDSVPCHIGISTWYLASPIVINQREEEGRRDRKGGGEMTGGRKGTGKKRKGGRARKKLQEENQSFVI